MLGRKWKGHMTGRGRNWIKVYSGWEVSFFAGLETPFLRELRQKKEYVTLDN